MECFGVVDVAGNPGREVKGFVSVARRIGRPREVNRQPRDWSDVRVLELSRRRVDRRGQGGRRQIGSNHEICPGNRTAEEVLRLVEASVEGEDMQHQERVLRALKDIQTQGIADAVDADALEERIRVVSLPPEDGVLSRRCLDRHPLRVCRSRECCCQKQKRDGDDRLLLHARTLPFGYS